MTLITILVVIAAFLVCILDYLEALLAIATLLNLGLLVRLLLVGGGHLSLLERIVELGLCSSRHADDSNFLLGLALIIY